MTAILEKNDGHVRPNRVPRATYRLQLNRDFTFAQARAIISYLDALGISDMYTSPLFRARPESTHGYDIANHNEINPVLGGAAEFGLLSGELQARTMGLLLDIVPNHMGIGESSNEWWMDVLENGPASIYAPFFDIDWQPVTRELEYKVLLPILGQQYGRVLENGELKLSYGGGIFQINYYAHCLPVNPRSYQLLLQQGLEDLKSQLSESHDDLLEYESILTGLSNLPSRTETDPRRVAERNREKEIVKRRLDALASGSDPVRAVIDTSVRTINGTPGEPHSFDLLDQLMDWQAYRLAYWRVAAEEINYRRFFDVNDLAAIRMEREEVFEATHRLLLHLFAEGHVTGIRLDHTDGLYDPAGYFARLQAAYASVVADDSPLYVLTEKILARGEPIPEGWAIYGTTGYDFLNAANSVFVDSSAERRFNEIYSDFIGQRVDFEELTYDTRRQIMRVSMASELMVLATALNRVAEHNRYYRDFTLNSLREALREVIACFPVYRTYIVADTDSVGERDQLVIEQTVARARRRNPAAEPTIYEFIRDVLLLRYPDTNDDEARDQQRQFVMRFQQMTGPVMAKGLEDTAFYIYNRLLSLNEVGGEPRHFGGSLAAFHRQNQERGRDWPFAMLASSTHDTKRSEDVRARINVLSELPEQWRTLLGRLARLNQRKKAEIEGQRAPDRNDEYLLYQTILGSLPVEPLDSAAMDVYVGRVQAYMTKAIHEAKVHTSWLNPNSDYDNAVTQFVAAVLRDPRFLAQISELQQTVAHFGVYNALAQTLLKLTAPGVPDIYQGTDMFDFSLVDPDNRRPVDYELRRYLLDEMNMSIDLVTLARQISHPHDNRSKLFLIWRVLNYRRDHPALFEQGDYIPLNASNNANDHVIAFARSYGGTTIISVAPRLLAKKLGERILPLGEAAWGEELIHTPGTESGQQWRNGLTGETLALTEGGLRLADVFANFPVALLEMTR